MNPDQISVIKQNFEAIPEAGKRYVREALRDPEARMTVLDLLSQYYPAYALTAQATKDIANVAFPQVGRNPVIVFKSLAEKIAPKMQAGVDSIVRAMPYQRSQQGSESLDIVVSSNTPLEDLMGHFMKGALRDMYGFEEPTEEQVAGLYGLYTLYEQDERAFDQYCSLNGLDGFSLKKAFKKVRSAVKSVGKGIRKVAKKAGPVVIPAMMAAAGIVATVVAGPVGGAAIGALNQALASGAIGGTGRLFGAGGKVGDICRTISVLAPAVGGGVSGGLSAVAQGGPAIANILTGDSGRSAASTMPQPPAPTGAQPVTATILTPGTLITPGTTTPVASTGYPSQTLPSGYASTATAAQPSAGVSAASVSAGTSAPMGPIETVLPSGTQQGAAAGVQLPGWVWGAGAGVLGLLVLLAISPRRRRGD